MENMYSIYEEILSCEQRWDPTYGPIKHEINHNWPDILHYPDSRNFIMRLFFFDGNLRSLSKVLTKYGKKIPEERYTHTVSLYLFGIMMAEKIGFEKFNLPKWDSDPRRNFLHYWSAICLFHDIGYAFEANANSLGLKECKTIEKLMEQTGIKYNLLASENSELIIGYYEYRRKKFNVIDHGIAGAMLLYDALMKRDAEMQELKNSGAFIFAEKPLCGEEYRFDIAEYATIIAKHNMWFAGDKYSVMNYKNFGLDELIAKQDKSHRISFMKKPVLFLLCLLDTIEPAKAYCEKPDMQKSPESALADCDIQVKKDNNIIRIELGDEMTKNMAMSCTSWLDVTADKTFGIEFSIADK